MPDKEISQSAMPVPDTDRAETFKNGPGRIFAREVWAALVEHVMSPDPRGLDKTAEVGSTDEDQQEGGDTNG